MKRFYSAIDATSALALAERRAFVVDVRAAMADDASVNSHLGKLTHK